MNHQFKISYIIPLFFNQKNTQTFDKLLNYYQGMSQEVLKNIQFIFVDDCSPIKINIPKTIKLNYQHLRVNTDIKWNQAGARNLGVTKSRTQKIILSDVDHLFDEKTLEKLIHTRIPNRLYKFKRKDINNKKKSSPCNILFTSKHVFFRALGYDEEFCGNYGYEDVFFRDIISKEIGRVRYFNRRNYIVEVNCNRHQSYHNLKRSTHINLNLYKAKTTALRGKCIDKAFHSGLFLNFDWDLVEEFTI